MYRFLPLLFLGACGSLRTNTRLPSFLPFFSSPSLPPFRKFRYRLYLHPTRFSRVIGDRSPPCKSLGLRCSFHRRAYFSRKDRANFISKERINQKFFEILPIWKNFKFFTVTINNIYRERFVE